MTGTNNLVDNALVGATGTGKFVGNVSPEISTSILDVNGNILLGLSPTGSAVNYINLSNNVTTMAPSLTAAGSDTNIPLTLQCKGTSQIQLGSNGLASLTVASAVASQVNFINVAGSATGNAVTINAGGTDTNIGLIINGKGNSGLQLQGTTAAGNATAGYVGEVITSNIASGSAVSITTTNTPQDITSINLTAGDWNVEGNVTFIGGPGDLATNAVGWISTTSATLPDASNYSALILGTFAQQSATASCPLLRVNVTTTTTVYLSAQATFASGPKPNACGTILARRVR